MERSDTKFHLYAFETLVHYMHSMRGNINPFKCKGKSGPLNSDILYLSVVNHPNRFSFASGNGFRLDQFHLGRHAQILFYIL